MATYDENGSDYVPGESNDRAVPAEPVDPPLDGESEAGSRRRPTAPGRPTHPIAPGAPGHGEQPAHPIAPTRPGTPGRPHSNG
jgi:hypothetical protein